MPSPSKPHQQNKKTKNKKTAAKRKPSTALIVYKPPLVNTRGAFDIKPVRQTNWPRLKAEFMADPDYTKPRTFLRERYRWAEQKLQNGNTIRNIEGWGNEKAQFRQRILDETLAELRQAERQRLPEALKAKLNVIASYIQEAGSIDKLGRLSIMDRTFILRALKTELGEPSTIGQFQQPIAAPQSELPHDVAERLAQSAIDS